MELQRDSFPKGLSKVTNLLAFQSFWEFIPFGKQLFSEKQIKPAIKLNLEFMKQNKRENQQI